MTDFQKTGAMRSEFGIARWLSERDPASSAAVTDAEFDAVRDRLRTAGQGIAPQRRRRRHGLTIGGAAAALLLVVGAPAAAITLFSAQTGMIVPEHDTENPVGSELIDLNADDIAAYAKSIFPVDLEVPEGVDIADVRLYEAMRVLERNDSYDQDLTLLAADQTIVDEYAAAVWCLWADELEQTSEQGDVSGAARARAVIVSAPRWDAVASPGSTYNGTSLQGFFRIAATKAEAGATSVHRYVAQYSGFGCSLHGDLDFYRSK